MRYRGQSYEVSVPVGPLQGRDDIDELIRRFHSTHHRRYGHMAKGQAIELVNFQITAIGTIPKPALKRYPQASCASPKPRHIRSAHFDAAHPVATPVFHRDALHPGHVIQGPAIIEEKTSTIVIYPDQTGRVDEQLNLDIALKQQEYPDIARPAAENPMVDGRNCTGRLVRG
jgi:N-methylhydantoinase A